MDIVRHLEDELSKGEQKLSNLPDLRLSEADKVSVLLQAIQPEVRQYVVLRGRSNDWLSLTTSLKYDEEQLRMCKTPGASNRAMSEILCDYCGKKGHKKENCWQKKRDERGEKVERATGKERKAVASKEKEKESLLRKALARVRKARRRQRQVEEEKDKISCSFR